MRLNHQKKDIILVFITILVCFNIAHGQQVKRIVSLVPWVTKSLQVMGESHRIVGCTSYCPINQDSHVDIVANAMNINIEKILLLKPDVVFASSLNKPETIDNLKRLGVKVILQPYPESFDEICTYFIQIGEVVNQSAKARQIIAQQKARLAKLKGLVPATKHPKVFIQIGAKPLFCAVPGTFMDDFIRFSGGKNIASNLKIGSITREYVIKQNPDVIFIVTMGIVAQEEKQVWYGYKSLSASVNKKVFILDADKTCSPTPILFVDALEEMIDLMY